MAQCIRYTRGMTREVAHHLLQQYIDNAALRRHCEMVAAAMEAYAQKLGHDPVTINNWYLAGLLHDLDWEKYPEQHPNYALEYILPEHGVQKEVLAAIAAHAPERTGKQPQSEIERYLFACDEISGFLDAVAKIRPNGFDDMKWSSVKKKMKASAFAANVPREDMQRGAELISTPLNEHVEFLISVFR